MLPCCFARTLPLGLVLQFCILIGAWEISDAPAPDLFLRRALANVAVLGNFLYIDGGEVSQRDAEGKPYTYTLNNLSRAAHPMNSTLSIDLSKSWAPANVTFRTIAKKPHSMVRQALWTREETDSFYIWGGHTPDADGLSDASLAIGWWRFKADGVGGGQWRIERSDNPTLYREIERGEDGAFASTPDGGFWFGGLATPGTRLNSTAGEKDAAPQSLSGMVSYNWQTNRWWTEAEGLKTALPPYGTIRGARASFVPKFGEHGIVVLMGGFLPAVVPRHPEKLTEYPWMDFSSVTFMDPVSGKWYSQKTTGDTPSDRFLFCMVGVEGDGTYEIFVFGGTPGFADRAYDDVFVLSLPGFIWKRVPIPNKDRQSRTDHHCAVAGKRQMIVVGGRNTTKTVKKTANAAAWADPDPWPQGLGLFDMTEWAWKTEYDATADAYQSHEEIQSWYRDGGVDSVQWSSEEVKAIFSPKRNGVSAGVIAGAVVGAVAGVGLLVFAGFWFIRRKRNRQETCPITSPPHPEDKETMRNASYFPPQPSEVHGHGQVELEADQTRQQELPATTAPVELEASHGLGRP